MTAFGSITQDHKFALRSEVPHASVDLLNRHFSPAEMTFPGRSDELP